MLLRTPLIVVFVIFSASRAGAQGTLDRVRGEVRDFRPSAPATSASGEPESSFLGELLSGLFGPFTFSAAEEENPYDIVPAAPMRFLTFPYQGNYPGFMSKTFTNSPEHAEMWKGKIHLNRWFGRITLDEGYDFVEGVNRVGGSFLIDTVSRWGVLSSWSILSERVGGRADSFTLGDANLTYRLIQSDDIFVRVGVGARTMIDSPRTDWGWNLHLDSDLFFRRPFVVSTVFDFGSLGDATVIHLRGTFGVTRRGWEIFGGYDWLRIGSVDIQGPLVGLRYWF